MPTNPRSNKPAENTVATFLSCSVRPEDAPLVDAIQYDVLEPMGFRCMTVGRNVSMPEQSDDAIKQILRTCHCLVGIATERLEATDRALPNRTLSLATPYLLQETSMAFQSDIPFLIIRTPGIALQGVTGRNLYIDINPNLTAAGKVKFKARKELVHSSLTDLKKRALVRRKKQKRGEWLKFIGWASASVLTVLGIGKAIDFLVRPDCFGDYEYGHPECDPCEFKADCGAELIRRAE
jgi:hypothetical protein